MGRAALGVSEAFDLSDGQLSDFSFAAFLCNI